jgi:hypothetical protein
MSSAVAKIGETPKVGRVLVKDRRCHGRRREAIDGGDDGIRASRTLAMKGALRWAAASACECLTGRLEPG